MIDLEERLSEELRTVRDAHLDSIRPDLPAARAELASKVRRRRFGVGIGFGLTVAAATAVVVVLGVVASDAPTPADRAQAPAGPVTPEGPTLVRTFAPEGGWIEVEEVATGGGRVLFYGGEDASKGEVRVKDGEVSSVTASRVIPHRLHPPGAEWRVSGLTASDAALFTLGSQTLSRQEHEDNSVSGRTEVEVGPADLLEVGERTVWVTAKRGDETSLLHFSADDLEPGPVEVFLEDTTITDMTYAEGSLWLASVGPAVNCDSEPGTPCGGIQIHRVGEPIADGPSSPDEAWALDPREGSVADVAAGSVASADDGPTRLYAWATRDKGEGIGNTLSRVDALTGEVHDRFVVLPETVVDVAFGEGYVWVTTDHGGVNAEAVSKLYKVDPLTGTVTGEPLVVGPSASPQVAVGEGFVWVTNPEEDSFLQIAP